MIRCTFATALLIAVLPDIAFYPLSQWLGERRVIYEDRTVCFDRPVNYHVKQLILQLAPELFQHDKLRSYVKWRSGLLVGYEEVSMLMVSSDAEIELITEVYVDTDKAMASRRERTEKYLDTLPSKLPLVAEYYRRRNDAVLWYCDGKTVSGPILLEGHDPYNPKNSPVPFCVIQNDVIISNVGDCRYRRMHLLVCPERFREEDLVALWQFLDRLFPVPEQLMVDVNSNASKLQRQLMGEYTMGGVYPFVLRGQSFITMCRSSGDGSASFVRDHRGKRYIIWDDTGTERWRWLAP